MYNIKVKKNVMSSPVEEIKSRLDIVSFIQGYVRLQKSGSNFKARCPFHAEKTPSFNVSVSREIWHCFGCGKGGDIFQFLMEIENIEFSEALRILAERAGVQLGTQDTKEKSERLRLLDLLDNAALFFERALEASEPPKQYLIKRGIQPQTMKLFRLGFAPHGWRNLIVFLKERGYTLTEMKKAGLVVQREVTKRYAGASQRTSFGESESGHYDRFRSRIIFPLIDTGNRVIGFGGRIFESGEAPTQSWFPSVGGRSALGGPTKGKSVSGGKYINTPATMFYDKSGFLYGFDKARHAIRLEEKAVIVEGYMDVLLSYQSGVKNVVAVSGTALTAQHLRLIKRFTDAVLFAFDMDEAGVKAARRAVELAVRENMQTALIELESGTDPADVACASPERWKEQVKNAVESIGFFLSRAIEKYSLKDAVSKRKIGAEVLPLVALLFSEIERAHWIGAIARRLSLSEEACWKELRYYAKLDMNEEQKRVQEFAGSEGVAGTSNRKVLLERRILGLLLLYPHLMSSIKTLPKKEHCTSEKAGKLFQFIGMQENLSENHADVVNLLDDDEKIFVHELIFEIEKTAEFIKDVAEELRICVKEWEMEHIRAQMADLQIKLRDAEEKQNSDDCIRILGEIYSLTARIR